MVWDMYRSDHIEAMLVKAQLPQNDAGPESWPNGTPVKMALFGINSLDFRAVILVFQDTLELSHLHFFHPPGKKKGPTNESFRIVCSN